MIEDLRARLAETETDAERLRREAQRAWDARLSAEERAGIAEEERERRDSGAGFLRVCFVADRSALGDRAERL